MYDGEGRACPGSDSAEAVRARPACGDDPVLWHEIHSTRGKSARVLFAERWSSVAEIALLVYLTSWFAVPAFVEVAEYGYGATPGKSEVPEVSPFARVLVARVNSKLGALLAAAAPGPRAPRNSISS